MCTINEDHIWFPRYNVRQTKFSTFWTIFCPFSPLTTWKIKIFSIEKYTWRYYHFTYLHHKWQLYDVWFLRYGAQRTECFVILDFFFALLPPINNKHMMYGSWYQAQRTEFFVILEHFLSFNCKKSKFEKLKRIPRDIIILHMCTINDSHMIYGSWDVECDRQNILSFWTIFCTFTPLTTQKIRILKKMKKPPKDIITLHMRTINDNHMMYGSWDMDRNGQTFCHFWTVFCPFTLLTTWKIKLLKNWKKTPGDIIILNKCTKNYDHMLYCSLDMGA